MRFGNIGKLLMFFVLLYRFRFLFYPRKYGVKASFAFGVRCGSRAGARRHTALVVRCLQGRCGAALPSR